MAAQCFLAARRKRTVGGDGVEIGRGGTFECCAAKIGVKAGAGIEAGLGFKRRMVGAVGTLSA